MSARPSSRSRTGASSTIVGIDPWGIGRALCRDMRRGRHARGRQHDHPAARQDQLPLAGRAPPARKIQEALIALWLEARLSKEEILSRYLSNVYFGDNVYGLRAAARHYFNVDPEHLTLAQAAMLAGRGQRALAARAERQSRRGARPRRSWCSRRCTRPASSPTPSSPRCSRRASASARATIVPTGTYFADWVAPAGGRPRRRRLWPAPRPDHARGAICSGSPSAPSAAPGSAAPRRPWSRCGPTGGSSPWSAARIMRRARSTAPSRPRRQPGSAFKLFVYLAAFRARPDPEHAGQRRADHASATGRRKIDGNAYRGPDLLRDAFAYSSNSVAVQLAERVGRNNVIQAARDLGITTPACGPIRACRSASTTSPCSS